MPRRVPDETPERVFLDDTHVRVGRRRLLYFGGCNYLGLAWDPILRRAFAKASRKGPIQTGASRRTTGGHRDFTVTEAAAARFFGLETAAWFGSGYLASLGAVDGLRNTATHVLLDAGSHRCLQDAARVSGLTTVSFANRDPDALDAAVRSLPPGSRPLVATDGVGPLQPGFPPLDEYLRRLPKSGWLVVDDAHGAGAVGPDGRGILSALGISDPRVVLCVTLAKAFASQGGLVLGSREAVGEIRSYAGAYTGSTAQPLALLALARASLKRVSSGPGRVRRLQRNQAFLASRAAALPRLVCDPRTPVSLWTPGSAAEAQSVRAALSEAGIDAPWIRYPGGADAGFFRFALNAAHTPADVERLVAALHSA